MNSIAVNKPIIVLTFRKMHPDMIKATTLFLLHFKSSTLQ